MLLGNVIGENDLPRQLSVTPNVSPFKGCDILCQLFSNGFPIGLTCLKTLITFNHTLGEVKRA